MISRLIYFCQDFSDGGQTKSPADCRECGITGLSRNYILEPIPKSSANSLLVWRKIWRRNLCTSYLGWALTGA